MQANPYQAPGTAVGDTPAEYGQIDVFSVAGRLGRVRYIGYSIGITLLGYALIAVGVGVGSAFGNPLPAMMIGVTAMVGMLVIAVMLTVQRCHDFNMSGWLALVSVVPLAPLLFWIVPGTPGANRYGNPPPPNTTGVVVLTLSLSLIFAIGIVAAVALPAYVAYQKGAQLDQVR